MTLICPIASGKPILQQPSSIPIINSYPVPLENIPVPIEISLIVGSCFLFICFVIMLIVFCSQKACTFAARFNLFALTKKSNASQQSQSEYIPLMSVRDPNFSYTHVRGSTTITRPPLFDRTRTLIEVFCTLLFLLFIVVFFSHLFAMYLSSSNDVPILLDDEKLNPIVALNSPSVNNELFGTIEFDCLLLGFLGDCSIEAILVNGSTWEREVTGPFVTTSWLGCHVNWKVSSIKGVNSLPPSLDIWSIVFLDPRVFGQGWQIGVKMYGTQNPNQFNSFSISITPPDSHFAFRGNQSTIIDLQYVLMRYEESKKVVRYGRRLYFQQYSLGSMVDQVQFNQTSGASIAIKLNRQEFVTCIKNSQLNSWESLLLNSVSSIGGLFTGVSIFLTCLILFWEKLGSRFLKYLSSCRK